MRHRAVGGTLALCLTVWSCGGAAPDSSSYVLLDPEARESGLSIQVGDIAVTGALPLEVDSNTPVVLLGAQREERLQIRPGEVLHIQGAKGELRHLTLGVEVARDALHVEGDEGAVQTLARQMGGRLTRDGSGWRVAASQAYFSAANAQVPGKLRAVVPVPQASNPVEASQPKGIVPPAAEIDSTHALSTSAVAPPTAYSVDPIPPQGFVVPTPRTVNATRAGGCTGAQGTWKGIVYSDPHSAYYEFTLIIRQSASNKSALQGTIVAHSWDATPDETHPPQKCGGENHWTVVQPATGTLDSEGAFDFAGLSWRIGAHLCGEKVTSYSLDHFRAQLSSDPSTIVGEVWDDAIWSESLTIELKRTSC